MTENGRLVAWTLGLWTPTAVGLGVTVAAGSVVFTILGSTDLALVRATGGGAMLASLAIEIMPDSYEGDGPAIAIATATRSS